MSKDDLRDTLTSAVPVVLGGWRFLVGLLIAWSVHLSFNHVLGFQLFK